MPVNADAGEFIRRLDTKLKLRKIPERTAWLSWCRERIQRYPVVLPEYRQKNKPVNPYVFSDTLARKLRANDVLVSSNGSSCVIPIQSMQIKRGQRHLVNSGCASMGYGLPAAIGACFANGRGRVICLEGDGSIQMNIQELETVCYHRLPLKAFIFNNGAYLSMRITQSNFFNGRFVGESAKSGVGFPDFVRLAKAYGIPACRVKDNRNLENTIDRVLEIDGPVLCDVVLDPDQIFAPRSASKQLADGRMVSSPLEDMYPFLEEEEFMSNMIISKWQSE